jgi:hypothetical protein
MKVMKRFLSISILALMVAVAPALADDHVETYEVTVVNLTAGQPMTPPILINHSSAFWLFKVGENPGPFLAELAETGSPAALAGRVDGFGAVKNLVTGSDLITPGNSATFEITVDKNFPYVSFASMFAMTNDAFVAARSVHVSDGMMVYANVWDAGSEENTEAAMDVPGLGGMQRKHANAEGFVHIHPGLHGGGDLDVAARNWQNPGALLIFKKVE